MSYYAKSYRAAPNDSPCWNNGAGCLERHRSCHTECKRYAEWRAKQDKRRDKNAAEQNRRAAVDNFVYDSKRRRPPERKKERKP
jgi:hypothetical protein